MPLQLAILTVTTAGSGFWIWWLAGRPRLGRNATWLWCGVAGYAVHTLLLQGLVYLNVPLRLSAPWAFGVAVAGALLGLVRGWRARRIFGIGRWSEIGFVIAAGLVGASWQGASLRGIGADRYVGRGTIDHVNYVLTAQFLVEQPYATGFRDVGLRPWLYKAIDAKDQRLTQCVALGAAAVVGRSDAQRAWGASALFFVALLGMAIAATARGVAGMAAPWAALTGAWAAATPAVATVLLNGFYSQLSTLWVFPALMAVGRAGALPQRAQVVVTGTLLAWLLGAYTEFFPLGLAAAALLFLRGNGALRTRIGRLAVVVGICAALTASYLPDGIRFWVAQSGNAGKADYLAVWATEAGTWVGWGRNFVHTQTRWDALGGGVLLTALLATWWLPCRRREWLWSGLAAAAALFAWLALQPRLPVYASHKLALGFAPLCVMAATAGVWAVSRRLPAGWTSVPVVGVGLLAAGSALGTWAMHRQIVGEAHGSHADDWNKIWAARDRVEAQPGHTWLVAEGNSYVGAWLCFFAREARVYYDLGSISDRRVPSGRAVFRQVPAGVPMEWLDLERAGPVQAFEPTPVLSFVDAMQTIVGAAEDIRVIARETAIIVERSRDFGATERVWFLELGFAPLAGVTSARVEFVEQRTGAVQAVEVRTPTLATFKIAAMPGSNRYTLRVTPLPAEPAARGLLFVQSVSLESRLLRFGSEAK